MKLRTMLALKDVERPWLRCSSPARRVLEASWVLLVCSAAAAAQTNAPSEQRSDKHHTFEAISAGRSGKPGAKVAFNSYKSEDGVVVVVGFETYKSPDAARQALEKLADKAERVRQRGVKRAANGQVVGERVELDFLKRANKVVAWRDGPQLIILRSPSRPHLLDFEEQMKAPGTTDPRSLRRKDGSTNYSAFFPYGSPNGGSCSGYFSAQSCMIGEKPGQALRWESWFPLSSMQSGSLPHWSSQAAPGSADAQHRPRTQIRRATSKSA